jgi:hypothetical protein
MRLALKARLRNSLGPRPREFIRLNTDSAESAIHSDAFSVHHYCHGPIAQQSYSSHHLQHEKPRAVARFGRAGRMHAYLATICRDLAGDASHVGGVADHVRIITTLPRTLSQAEMIEQIKKASSKWIKTVEVRYRGFFWHAVTPHFQ